MGKREVKETAESAQEEDESDDFHGPARGIRWLQRHPPTVLNLRRLVKKPRQSKILSLAGQIMPID